MARVHGPWILVLIFGMLARPAAAGEAMTPTQLRTYCGYLTSLQDEKIAKLRGKKQLKKIARSAKIKLRNLKKAIDLGKTWGDDCDQIQAAAEKKIMSELQGTRLKGRVEFVEVRGDEWDQLVVRIRWKGQEDRFLEEEAAVAAAKTFAVFPMAHTMACAAYNPFKPDESWFEGIIANSRMANIQESRINTFADTRYIRLFDNKKFAKPR